jgi:hypothetical protein
MSMYLMGLLTVPAILVVTIGLWLLLKLVTSALPIIGRTLTRNHSDGQRNAIASVVGASTRAWHIGGGDNIIIFAHGLDHAKAKEAKQLLDHDGPWSVYAKLPDAIPAWKPGRNTTTPTTSPEQDKSTEAQA